MINRSLDISKSLRSAFNIASGLFYASIIYQCRREIDAVYEYAEALIELASDQELIYFAPGGLCAQGWSLAARGEPELGLAKFRQGLAIWQASGIAANLSPAYVALADIYYRCGHIDAGLQALDEAHAIIHTNTERYYEAEAYRLRGELLLHPSLDDPKQAEICFEQARDIAVHQHAKAWELRATMSLCRLWREQGRRQDAHHLLEPVYNWFKEGLTTQDLLEARALLDSLRAP